MSLEAIFQYLIVLISNIKITCKLRFSTNRLFVVPMLNKLVIKGNSNFYIFYTREVFDSFIKINI